ncbi:MAG: hypothetical protein U1F48_00960 [Burkholderiales bacterium]
MAEYPELQLSQLDELRELTAAARRNDPRAQAALGLAYELGHGVERDALLAAHFYHQAAESGECRAQFLLGNLYEHGVVATPNPDIARIWFARAAYCGHPAALRRLEALAASSLKDT